MFTAICAITMTTEQRAQGSLTEFQPNDLDALLSGGNGSKSGEMRPDSHAALANAKSSRVLDTRRVSRVGSDASDSPGHELKVELTTDGGIDSSDGSFLEMKSKQSRRRKAAISRIRLQLSRIRTPVKGDAPVAVVRLEQALQTTRANDVSGICQLIGKLGELGSEFAVPIIEPFIDRKVSEIRNACSSALARIPAPQAGILLVDFLNDDSKVTVASAIEGLVVHFQGQVLLPLVELAVACPQTGSLLKETAAKLEEDVRGELQALLLPLWESSDTEVAAYAIGLTSRIAVNTIVDQLQPLLPHGDPRVRCAVIEAMAASEEKKAVRFLNAALGDSSAEVRVAAANGLRKNFSPRSLSRLVETLHDERLDVRKAVSRTLASIDLETRSDTATTGKKNKSPQFKEVDFHSIVSSLIRMLKQEPDPQVQQNLVDSLGRLGCAECIPVLEDFLNNDRDTLRDAAANSICRLATDDSAGLIHRLLDDFSPEVRRRAVDAIGRSSIKSLQKRVETMLNADPSVDVRAAAARALGSLGARRAVGALKAALEDDHVVQCQAIIALGRIRSTSATQILRQQLSDVRPEIKCLACTALAEIGAIDAVPAILELTEHSDPMVKRAATNSLHKLGYRKSWLTAVQRRVIRPVISAFAVITPAHVMGLLRTPAAGIATAMSVVAIIIAVYFHAAPSNEAGGADFLAISLVRDCAVSADGTKALVLRKFGIAEVWDCEIGKLLKRIGTVPKSANKCAFLGDKATFFSPGQMAVWDIQTGASELEEVERSASKGEVVEVVSAVEAGLLFALCSNGFVDVLNENTGELIRTLELQFRNPISMSVSADGRLLAIADHGTITGWYDTETGESRDTIDISAVADVEEQERNIVTALSSSGRLIAIAPGKSSFVVIDTVERTLFARLANPFSNRVCGLGFSADGMTLTAADTQGRITTLSLEAGEQLSEFRADLEESASKYAFAANAAVCVISMDDGTDLTVVDPATGTTKHRLVP